MIGWEAYLAGLIFYGLPRTGVRIYVRIDVPERKAVATELGLCSTATTSSASGMLAEAAGKLETYLAEQTRPCLPVRASSEEPEPRMFHPPRKSPDAELQ